MWNRLKLQVCNVRIKYVQWKFIYGYHWRGLNDDDDSSFCVWRRLILRRSLLDSQPPLSVSKCFDNSNDRSRIGENKKNCSSLATLEWLRLPSIIVILIFFATKN